jgi:hypothetical protein
MKTQMANLCLTGKCAIFFSVVFLNCSLLSYAQTIDYGKSFVNISKGTNGGTISPGDTLQIRATFVVKAGTVDSCAYYDTIPAGTSYIPGTLAVLTNEGKVYKSFTDAYGGPTPDQGWIIGNNLQINLGYGAVKPATQARRGEIKNTSKPSFYGGTCIMVASYEVVVTAAYMTAINVGGGSISYSTATPTVLFQNFPRDSIMVFKNYGICANSISTNAILSEFGGTFGSGNTKDRVASSNVPANYAYTPFSSALAMPNDYYYGISNNTSGGTTPAAGYSTVNTWAYPDNSQAPSHRIFSVWDIIGDHTGAVNPLLGNPPTDDAAGHSGGYMAVINSSYRTDIAFLDTVSNLCPNTYYQYTAWIYNMCPKCGCDSNGVGASGGGYIPTAAGDSSGVHPNLTFNVNGYDYYSTGNILHTGQWIQKGFTYLTGPAQTSMVIYIRNNAPGGGGNDWAVDDIAVATCVPSITLTPNKPDTLCQGADDTVRFSVSAFFNNYTQWVLQKSTDGGLTWLNPGPDTLGQLPSGTGSPVYNPLTSMYQYLVTRYYRLTTSDSLVIYRLTIASTVANLANSNCNFITSTPKIVRAVNCNIVLATSVVLKGWLASQTGNLQWTSTNESEHTQYLVERSDGDQLHFQVIATVDGTAVPGAGSTYLFQDPQLIGGPTYYRIEITKDNYANYSKVVLLSNTDLDFDLKTLGNPFVSIIAFDLVVPADQAASITVYDMYGRLVRKDSQAVYEGLNAIKLYGFDGLQDGVYVLRVQCGANWVAKKMVKLSY